MTRLFFHGGFYVDATPAGSFVLLYVGSHLQTHLGRVELPPGETWGVGFVRCTDVDGFRFAGQAHDTENPACWEWDAGTWVPYQPNCCGQSPVIYSLDGELLRASCAPPTGSQGYRYVAHDGRVWTGDETYSIDLGAGRRLFEYSAAAELLIGQAAYDCGGVQVWDGSTLRQLELGDCRFVRVQWAGDAVSVAYVKPDGAVVVQTTLAELRALSPVEPPDGGGGDGGDGGDGGGGDGGDGGDGSGDSGGGDGGHEPPPYPPVTGAVMQTERGWLIGPGDKALAIDAHGKATFDRTDLTDQDVLEAVPQGDGRCVVRPVHRSQFAVGTDATKYSPVGVCGQYYGTTNAPGNYELWSFGQWPSGIVQAVVEYINQGADHGHPWQGAGLTWVKQA